jgi:polyferredoxin
VQDTHFRTLLYRYFFFGWLFKDVTRGNLFERAAAWRYNREQARWLPTYLWRWTGWGLFFYGIGGLLEIGLDAPLLSMLFYVPSALSVPIGAVTLAAYIGFKALPGPL